MPTIAGLDLTNSLGLKTYRQPNSDTEVKIIHGDNFYARVVNNNLHEWTTNDTPEGALKYARIAIKFEEKLGSKLL